MWGYFEVMLTALDYVIFEQISQKSADVPGFYMPGNFWVMLTVSPHFHAGCVCFVKLVVWFSLHFHVVLVGFMPMAL